MSKNSTSFIATFITFSLLFSTQSGNSQSVPGEFSMTAGGRSGIVSGTVTASGQPLPSAVVSANGKTALADSAGHYRMELRAGSHTLTVTHVGYETNSRKIVVTGNREVSAVFAMSLRGEQLNEMVVTGVSKATRIRETPLNVAFVSSRAIARENESNIMDALVKNVPGLNVVKTGPNISKPFIRGLGYNRVLTLYDGFRQEGQQWGDEHGIEVDAYNVDKAEVVKGPASLLFGSDAVAGVVSLFPWLPATGISGLQGRVVNEYQSNNGLMGTGFRAGSVSGNWLWAVSSSYRIAKNYSNPVDGRVYNTGFREANAAATIQHNSDNGYSRLSATLYDNRQGIPDGSRDSLSRRFSRQVAEGNADNILDRPLLSQKDLEEYSLSPLHQHIQHYRVYNINHYNLGPGVLETILGFQQSVRREYSHPTAPLQPGLYVRLNTVNYGLKYLVTLGDFEWTVGANGMFQQNSSRTATDFPIPDYHLRDVGPYLLSRWKKEKWSITGGLRYDTRELKGNDFYTAVNPVTGFMQQVSSPDSNAGLQFARFNKTFHGLSLSIGAAYALTEKISLKANLGRGYRSPNITEYAANGLDPGAHIVYIGNRNFNPEFSLQEDLGVYAWWRDLTASFALFNNHIQDYIYLDQRVDGAGNPQTDAQGNKTFGYEQSAAQLFGGELFADWHPARWHGFHFINSASMVRGYNRGRQYNGKANDGENLPLIPPLKWVTSLTREIELQSGVLAAVSGKIEFDYNAPQKRYLKLYQTETSTAAYGLLNLALGASVRYHKDKKIQLQVQVNNLLNVAYQSNLSRLKYFEYYNASPNGRSGIYNMGRDLCLKLITEF